MRIAPLLLVIVLAACSSTPFASGTAPAASVAVLTVRPRPNYPASPGYDGITAVDGQGLPKGPAMSVALKPRRPTITYSCPGWFSVDSLPKLSSTFQAGTRYELECEKDPHVEVVR